MILRNLRFNFGLKLVRNTGNLIKGPGVVASVACFGWWTASDVAKDLLFQLWLNFVRNTRNLIKGPGVASVAGFRWWTASDVPKDLCFNFELKTNEKYRKPD